MAMLNLGITGNKFTVEMADGMSEVMPVKASCIGGAQSY